LACSPMVWSTVGVSDSDRLGALSTGRTFVTEKSPFRPFFREATRETDSGKNLLVNEILTSSRPVCWKFFASHLLR
ncbi:hypothetical protein, partial [Stenotrophomonas maltophilia]|uniref:hypothetical protein n=1 Tax=Stenotrophomonas maltophilia TaxID=40324 RepID=UPI001954B024